MTKISGRRRALIRPVVALVLLCLAGNVIATLLADPAALPQLRAIITAEVRP